MFEFIKYKYALLALLLWLTACSNSENLKSNIDNLQPLLIQEVNIVDVVNQRVIENQQILIEDGKITAISPMANSELLSSTKLPPNTQIHKAKGNFVLPGLIDMHVHPYSKSAMELSLSHGVTHVRIMNGVSQHLEWRKQVEQGQWLASSMTVSSPIVRGDEQPLSWTAPTPAQARHFAQLAHEQGYDLIKAYGSLNAGALEALISEANRLNIPVAKHGPHPPVNMNWQHLNNMQSLEHVEDIYQGILNHSHDLEKLPIALSQIASTKVPVTPTLNIYWQLTQLSAHKEDFIDTLPQDYISPIIAMEDKTNQVKRWLESDEKMAAHNQKTLAFMQHITSKLKEYDIPVLVGSDAGVLLSPFGLATLNEMKLLSESGMSNFEVLRSATILPATALGKSHQFGSIAVGKQADMILLSANPLIDLSNLNHPTAVIKRGHWLDSPALESLRKKAQKGQSFWQELWLIASNY